jgi:hypothetical protein
MISLTSVTISFYRHRSDMTTVAVKDGQSFFQVCNDGPLGVSVEELEQQGFFLAKLRVDWYESETGGIYAYFEDAKEYAPLFGFDGPIYKESEVEVE